MVTLSLFYFFVGCVLVFRIVQMSLLFKNYFNSKIVLLVGDFSLVFDFLIGVTHTENLCCCILALRDMQSRLKNINYEKSRLRTIFHFCLVFWNAYALILAFCIAFAIKQKYVFFELTVLFGALTLYMLFLTVWLSCEMKRSGNFMNSQNEMTSILVTLLVFCLGYSIQVAKNAASYYFYSNLQWLYGRYCWEINLV